MARVLIIDDEEELRRVYARALSREFEVECAVDVETGIEALSGETPFDAILCDLNLPRMKGDDMHAHLLQHAPHLAGRLVIITGEEPRVNDAFTEMLLRSERYLVKTCPMVELMETIRRVIALPSPSAK